MHSYEVGAIFILLNNKVTIRLHWAILATGHHGTVVSECLIIPYNHMTKHVAWEECISLMSVAFPV